MIPEVREDVQCPHDQKMRELHNGEEVDMRPNRTGRKHGAFLIGTQVEGYCVAREV